MGNGLLSYHFSFRKHGWNIFFALAVLLFLISLTFRITSENAEKAAEAFGNRIEKRLRILDGYAEEALHGKHDEWLDFKDLPRDMVIYRYMYDTLQSWCNQFPVNNDNISARMIVKRLSNLRAGMSSPLSDIPAGPSYMNLGSKCYIMKTISDQLGCKIVYGLEVQDILLADRQNSDSGVNPALRLPKKYVVTSLNHTGGAPVMVGGEPLLKIISETTKDIPFPMNCLRHRYTQSR